MLALLSAQFCFNILKENNIQPVVPCTQAGVCGARERRTADGGDRWSRTSATRSADSGDCVFQRCCSNEGLDGGGPGGGGGGGGGADGGLSANGLGWMLFPLRI